MEVHYYDHKGRSQVVHNVRAADVLLTDDSVAFTMPADARRVVVDFNKVFRFVLSPLEVVELSVSESALEVHRKV